VMAKSIAKKNARTKYKDKMREDVIEIYDYEGVNYGGNIEI